MKNTVKNRAVAFGVLLAISFYRLMADSTPIDQGVPEGKSTSITCTYEGNESFASIGLKEKPAAGEYHYEVYLPKGYASDKEKSFPCLFVMSPGGHAKLGRVTADLERLQWIGIALQEAKNGPWEPITGNFLAAHDDAAKRFRILEGEKYATGFSGGARGCSLFSQIRPGFKGLVLQGAGFWFDTDIRNAPYEMKGCPRENFRVYMIVGKDDGNKVEIDRLKKALPSSVKFKSELFEGKHQAAPDDLLSKGLDWISGKHQEGAETFEEK